MSLSLREKDLKDRQEVAALVERMLAGITLFERDKGCMPAAMLVDYEMFWRILHNDHIMITPGHIVELDGVRVIPSPDLDGQIYLVESLYEVPDVVLLEDS